MNPYQAPTTVSDEERSQFLHELLAVFCFGWAFGTLTRGQLDGFGWLGVVVFIAGVLLLQRSSASKTG